MPDRVRTMHRILNILIDLVVNTFVKEGKGGLKRALDASRTFIADYPAVEAGLMFLVSHKAAGHRCLAGLGLGIVRAVRSGERSCVGIGSHGTQGKRLGGFG